MTKFAHTGASHLNIDDDKARLVIDGARDASPVSGLTHNFYRYPARFSPKFARAVISAFTKPGDFVFDPFMGGGTTLVEAHASGRIAAGTDISSLAAFISQVKTTVMTGADIAAIEGWSKNLAEHLNIHKECFDESEYGNGGYQRNLNSPETWRLRKLINQAIDASMALRFHKRRDFARCTVLKTAQWALDGRKTRPSVPEFRARLLRNISEMLEASAAYSQNVQMHKKVGNISPKCVHSAMSKLDGSVVFDELGAPKLVVTSPPYPGIHVLYHRWQVDGRKETPAPFWIANKLDGLGGSFYTMGDRNEPGHPTYYANIEESFSSMRAFLKPSALVVQMVAFSDARRQLPRYLETMEEAGYEEFLLPQCGKSRGGRLWRDVPNRKWHAQQQVKSPGGREVVLFHRVARARTQSQQPIEIDQTRSQ